MNDDFNWLPYEEEEQEPAQRSRRGLARLIPRFLRRTGPPAAETRAADLALQMGERPIEELDDRLLALRNRARSRPPQEAPSAREALYDVDEVLVTPEIIHRPGGVISPLALSKAQQEQVELLRDMVGGTAPQDDGESDDGLLPRDGRAFSLGAVPGLLVSILMLLALALPFVSAGFRAGELPPPLFLEDRRGSAAAFNRLDNLSLGDYVLVAFEYGPAAAGELDDLADVILRHIFAQGAKPIIVSSNPIAIAHARNLIAAIERSVAPASIRLVENRDYYLLRFLSGGALGLRDLSRNFRSIVKTSARSQPTGLAFASLDELTLMALIAERAEDIRHWAEQVATETDSDLIAAVGYAAQPLAQPYVDAHDSIVGMFVGIRDAYTYARQLQANYADFELPPRREDSDTDDEEAVEPTATATATAPVTATPTEAPTEAPTEVPTEAPTEPPATATPTVEATEPEPEVAALAAEPAATATPALIPVAEVIAPGLINIRRRPNTVSDILAVASAGDTFAALGENEDGSWINILLPDGIEAWIASFLVEQYLASAEESLDASARAGSERTVLRLDFSLRLGKNQPRFYQVDPSLPADRPEFILLRDRRGEEQRLDAMTLGTIAAVLVIVAGNVFYLLRSLTRRRRADQRN